MDLLKRKIYDFLLDWKTQADKMPLIVKGARQIGKTKSICNFAQHNYKNVVIINFVLQEKFKVIFRDGFEVDDILKNITLIDPSIKLIPNNTIIFFDELQACPSCATSLKAFKIDGRFDVICSGSLMGINYQEIESNSVGYKEDYEMHSMDFEEFLWAKGYSEIQIEEMYIKMRDNVPFTQTELEVYSDCFREYMTIGGMPAVVNSFVQKKTYTEAFKIQRQLLFDYEEDITKYAQGLDKGKIKNIYKHISVFLGKENKKFQISKVAANARNRDYIGTVEWLNDAGVVNVCYCMDSPELPLKGNYNPKHYKLYYRDTGLLFAALDEEAQEDIRMNRNFNTYKGAIYENIVADMLAKQGYNLYFYRDERSSLEIDFLVRDFNSLVPIEVKATDGATPSLNRFVNSDSYSDVKYGIKFCSKNIGFNGNFYTFPYFLVFHLRRFLRERR